MTNPYPITRETREEAIFRGDGSASYGPFDLRVFDVADVAVWTRADDAAAWTEVSPTVTKTTGLALDTFSIAFPTDMPATVRIKVQSRRVHERSAGVVNGTRIDPNALEKELSKLATTLQELRRDIDRGVQVQFGAGYVMSDDIEDGDTLMKSGAFIVKGASAADITLAQGYASDAADSAEEAGQTLVAVGELADAVSQAAAGIATAIGDAIDDLGLPSAISGDEGKALVVAPDLSGYDLQPFPVECVARVSAVATLKALNTSASELAYLSASGRAGFFARRTGTAPFADAQDGEFITSDTAGFYWERIGRTGVANAQHFGAVGDGATDNAAVINAMITAGYKTIYLPSRTPTGAEANYRFNAQIVLPGGVAIVGDRCRTKISMAAAMSADLFSVRGVGNSLTNIECIGNSTQTNWLIKLQTNLGNVSYFWADNIYTTNCNGFIADANSTGIATNITVTNFGHRQPTGRFCLLYDCFAFIFFIKGFADYVGVTAASTNVPVVTIVGNQGAIFENFDVLGGTITGMSSRSAFYVESSEAVWFRRCMGDTMGGHAFFITGSTYVYLDNCSGSLCDNHQFYFVSSVYVIVTNFYAGGRQGIGGASASKCGIAVTGVGPVNINGGIARNNTGRGILTDGTNPVLLAVGITMVGNGAGNYALTGSFSHVAMSQLSSGALLTSATGTSG